MLQPFFNVQLNDLGCVEVLLEISLLLRCLPEHLGGSQLVSQFLLEGLILFVLLTFETS